MTYNLPTSFVQGDYVEFKILLEYTSSATVTVFIRGMSNPLDLTGVHDGSNGWDFQITETQSMAFDPGNYQIQLVVFDPHRETLGVYPLHICPSFENQAEVDTRSPEEIELEQLNAAISALTSKNIAEYYIGIRRVRYHDLASLYDRQAYLRRRIARMKNKSSIGGCNVPVSFCEGG